MKRGVRGWLSICVFVALTGVVSLAEQIPQANQAPIAQSMKKTKPVAPVSPPGDSPAPIPAKTEREYEVNGVDLVGEMRGDNITFCALFTVKTEKAVEVPVVSGDLCELNSKVSFENASFFGMGDDPSIQFKNGGYVLICPGKGECEVSFMFAAKVETVGKTKRCRFDLLPAISRQVQIESDVKDIEFEIADALNLTKTSIAEGSKTTITATLAPEGPFAATWKRHIEKIESELVTSVKSRMIYSVSPGTVKLSAMFDFAVIQGELAEMRLRVSPELSILNVAGGNVRDWRLEEKGGETTLAVRLGRTYEDQYRLGVEAEKILPDFPCEFSLPAMNPLDALRVDGLIAFGTSQAVKLIVDDVRGMNQVDNRSFGAGAVLGAAPPTRSLFTYRYFGDAYGAKVSADNIVPNFSLDVNVVLNVKDEEMDVKALCRIDVKDAPLRELMVRFPRELMVNRVRGVAVEEDAYEIVKREDGEWLKIPFKANTIGKTDFALYFERGIKKLDHLAIPEIHFENAKNVRGFLLLAGAKGLTLGAEDLAGLSRTHTGSAPVREPGLQLAYRFKSQDWSGTVTIKREKAAIASELFHLLSVGEGTVYGSSVFTWHLAGAPEGEILFSVSPKVKNLEFTGRDIVDWVKLDEKDGDRDLWRLNLREKIIGDYTLLATYESSFPEGGEMVELAAIATKSAEAENGFIALTSQRNLKVVKVESSETVHPIEVSEIPFDYRKLIENPILKSWRFDAKKASANVALEAYPSERLLGVVVDWTGIKTSVDSNGEAVTTIQYRVKNSDWQFLALRLPAKADLWSVTVNDQRKRLSLRGDKLLIPLPRYKNVDAPIPITLTYALKHGSLEGRRRIQLNAPVLDVESMFCRWEVDVPSDFSIASVGGEMRSSFHPPLSGLGGLVVRAARLAVRWMGRGVFIPWAVATLAGLILAWSWGGRRLRIFATVLGVVLIGVALISLLAILDRGGLTPRPEPFSVNRVEFSSLFRLPGDAMTLDLEIDDMRTASGGGVAWSVGCLLLALAGFSATFFGGFKSATLRSGMAALSGALLLTAAARWLTTNVLAAVGLTIFIPIGFSVALWLLVYRSRARKLASALIAAAIFAAVDVAAVDVDPIVISDANFGVVLSEKSLTVEAVYKVSAEVEGSIELLAPPAVITTPPAENDAFKIIRQGDAYRLSIEETGDHSVSVRFLLPFTKENGVHRFDLAIPDCSRNQVEVSVDMKNMEVSSDNAAFFNVDSREPAKVTASFAPGTLARFKVGPRVRDVEKERTRFFASVESVATFAAGFAQINHAINLRIAQGEASRFTIKVPENMSVTDVQVPDLGAWRYDPESRALDVLLSQPKHGDLRLDVTTQIANLTLPYAVDVAALKVADAARQHGSVGLFVDSDVRLSVGESQGFNLINNSDFSARPRLGAPAVLKKAFRYHQVPASINVKTTAVEPEIRVYENCQLLIGEERSVLSSKLRLEIAKAGVFSTSIELPDAFEVDKITGADIQHWDEIAKDGRSVARIHFNRKILGNTGVFVEMSKMGDLKSKRAVIPRLRVEGAKRHTGDLTVTVEKGTRMNIVQRQGLEKTDGAFKKAIEDTVYRFAILRPDWALTVSFDVADPWIQVENLQLARLRNGFVRCEAFFHYSIENAGVKRFRLHVPEGADTPEITGADIVAITNPETNVWEVELHRKTMGSLDLMARYRMDYPEGGDVNLKPVKALGVDLVKGYVAVFTEDSLGVTLRKTTGETSPFDPRKIPGSFRVKDLANAVICLRVIGADFSLDLALVRHQIAKTLKAEIERIDLASVVSTKGRVVTRAEVSLNNLADQTFLRASLPKGSVVWAVFVDTFPVDAASEGDVLLVPLRQGMYGSVKQTVEFVYSSQGGNLDARRPPRLEDGGTRGGAVEETAALPPTKTGKDSAIVAVDSGKGTSRFVLREGAFQCQGPSFDLPLRRVAWKLYLPRDKEYERFGGTLDYVDDSVASLFAKSVTDYDRVSQQQADLNTNQAKVLFQKGNQLARAGRKQDAMKLYQQASNLSENDFALNTDIQGQQMKVQREEAIASFAARRGVAQKQMQTSANNAALRITPQQEVTQAQRHPIDVGALKRRLGGVEVRNLQSIFDKVFMQQKAAMTAPQPLRVTLPEEGRVVTFERRLQITENAPLKVSFDAVDKRLTWSELSGTAAFALVVVVLLAIFAVFAAALRKVRA